MRPERRSVAGLAEALPALEASLAEDPSPRNVMRVAEGLWLAGKPDRAAGLLEGLVREHPTAIAPRVLLAWSLEDLGRPEEARGLLREVHGLDPANPYAAEAAEAAESPEAGEAAAEPERALTPEELREVPPGPLYSATLAEIFARQGFEEKAIEIYREIARLHPERSDVRSRIRALEGRIAGEAPR